MKNGLKVVMVFLVTCSLSTYAIAQDFWGEPMSETDSNYYQTENMDSSNEELLNSENYEEMQDTSYGSDDSNNVSSSSSSGTTYTSSIPEELMNACPSGDDILSDLRKYVNIETNGLNRTASIRDNGSGCTGKIRYKNSAAILMIELDYIDGKKHAGYGRTNPNIRLGTFEHTEGEAIDIIYYPSGQYVRIIYLIQKRMRETDENGNPIGPEKLTREYIELHYNSDGSLYGYSQEFDSMDW